MYEVHFNHSKYNNNELYLTKKLVKLEVSMLQNQIKL